MPSRISFPASAALAALSSVALPTVGAAQPPATAALTGGAPEPSSTWPHPAAPTANPFPRSTASLAERQLRDRIAQLGKALFWEEQVSSDNTVACGTCHMPEHGGTDGRLGAVHANGTGGSFGVIQQTQNGALVDYGSSDQPDPSLDRAVTPVAAPTMIGAYLFEKLFWDKRAGPALGSEADPATPVPGFGQNAALEDLAVQPPLSEVEMGHEGLSWANGFIQAKLGAARPLALVDPTTIPADISWVADDFTTYADAFDDVFGAHQHVGGALGVTRTRFAMAIAHYQRTLIPDQAPIDLGTMSDNQVEGFNILKANECLTCHSATANPTLVNGKLANPWDNLFSNGQGNQIGLLQNGVAVPVRKAPTLRNVGLRKKFFSIGVVLPSHAHMVRSYNQGDTQVPRSPVSGVTFDPPLTPTQEAKVVDFLVNALTDPRVAAAEPPFDHPQLHSQTVTFGANEFGGSTPAGIGPEIIANAPPLVPTGTEPDWLKLGVGHATPGAVAVVMFSLTKATQGPVWLADPIYYDFAPAINWQGMSTYRDPSPLNASVIGTPLHFQWMVVDNDDYTYSNAATFLPFRY